MNKHVNKAVRVQTNYFLLYPKRAFSALKCRVTVGGKPANDFVVESSVEAVFWSQELQKLLDNSPESATINQHLRLVKNQLQTAAIMVEATGKPLTAQAVKEAYFEAQQPAPLPIVESAKVAPRTFGYCFLEFVRKKRTDTRNKVCARTMQAYFQYNNKFLEYLQAAKSKSEERATAIKLDYAERYLTWLVDDRGHHENYANKCVDFLRQVLVFAENSGLIDRNPLKGLQLQKSQNYDTTHLDPHELADLVNFDFHKLPIAKETAKSLTEERDCFVFTCYTGQHHSDILDNSVSIFTGDDGRKWLTGNRKKTGQVYQLPLHSVALAVVEKYDGIGNLPVKSNSKRNELLKQIAAFCGIPKLLTTKIGRKTFADFALNVMVASAETVAEVLGQSSTKYLKHYSRVSQRRIAKEFNF